MNSFVIYNYSDLINKPQMLAVPKTNEVRDFCAFPFILYLGELSCVDD